MATSRDILRLTAFSSDPAGGNPAGVVLDARGLDDSELQSVAAEIGYAETAFLIEPVLGGNPRHSRIRYFSPIAEVPFCGHATIATAIALTERDGDGTFTFRSDRYPSTRRPTRTERPPRPSPASNHRSRRSIMLY
nr:PhzF family phenazine biosynthesis isomerase [Rhodococcus qingshengii]